MSVFREQLQRSQRDLDTLIEAGMVALELLRHEEGDDE